MDFLVVRKIVEEDKSYLIMILYGQNLKCMKLMKEKTLNYKDAHIESGKYFNYNKFASIFNEKWAGVIPMVTFKLISHIGDEYTYEYYPNGNVEEKGTFCFNPVKKELIYHKKCPPQGMNFFVKAVSGLCDENGNFLESGMVAWY